MPNTQIIVNDAMNSWFSGSAGFSKGNQERTNSGDGYLGRFGRETVSRTVNVDPNASELVVTFDFLELDSWTSESAFMYVDGIGFRLDIFSSDRAEGTYGWINGREGIQYRKTDASDSFDFAAGDDPDQRHSYEIKIPSSFLTDGEVKLDWWASLDQPLDNESWGLDNFKVTQTVPDSSPGLGFDDSEALKRIQILQNYAGFDGTYEFGQIKDNFKAEFRDLERDALDILLILDDGNYDATNLTGDEKLDLVKVLAELQWSFDHIRDVTEDWQGDVWNNLFAEHANESNSWQDWVAVVAKVATVGLNIGQGITDYLKVLESTKVLDQVSAGLDLAEFFPKLTDGVRFIEENLKERFYGQAQAESTADNDFVTTNNLSDLITFASEMAVRVSTAAGDEWQDDAIKQKADELLQKATMLADEFTDLSGTMAARGHFALMANDLAAFDPGKFRGLGLNVESVDASITWLSGRGSADKFVWKVSGEGTKESLGVDTNFDYFEVTERVARVSENDGHAIDEVLIDKKNDKYIGIEDTNWFELRSEGVENALEGKVFAGGIAKQDKYYFLGTEAEDANNDSHLVDLFY